MDRVNEASMSSWKVVERRNKIERRRQERRRSIRYTADTLVVVTGITWIDNEGTDRRRKVRRRDDRERLARKILDDTLVSED
jgi:hypothetical protein